MDANKLNKIIQFEKSIESKDRIGAIKTKWVFFKEAYAATKFIGGTTEYDDGAQAFTDKEFIIRYDPEIDYNKRIVLEEDGQVYQIKHIEILNRYDFQKIITVKWVDGRE